MEEAPLLTKLDLKVFRIKSRSEAADTRSHFRHLARTAHQFCVRTAILLGYKGE